MRVGREIGEGTLGMTTVHFDARLDDQARRERLYQGDIFVYGPTPETLAFKDFAGKMIEDAFGGLDPEMAQAVRVAFVRMWERGLVYRGARL
ncbi:MAG: hypothetical protein IIB66_06710, partial [Proteobacteria bacterium]|nr:hypothetical protein [Pseudomonadota bacterium]